MTSEIKFYSRAFSCPFLSISSIPHHPWKEIKKKGGKTLDIIKAEIISDASELLGTNEENKALSHSQDLGITF